MFLSSFKLPKATILPSLLVPCGNSPLLMSLKTREDVSGKRGKNNQKANVYALVYIIDRSCTAAILPDISQP